MKLEPLVRRVRQIPTPWAAAALAFAGLALVYLGTAKTVSLVVDGRSVSLRTHAQTVAAAIRDAGFSASAADFVEPALATRLRGGETIRLENARPVILSVDGARWAVESPLRIPANILAQAEVPLYPGDTVWADGIPLADPSISLGAVPARLRVERGHEIVLNSAGRTRSFRSTAPTIAAALWQAGIALRDADRLEPGAESPLQDSTHAVLEAGRPVTIVADGVELEAWASAGTVGEALAQAGLTPTGLDYAVPAANEPVPEDGRIRLVRVREEIVVEQEPLPFDTTYEALPDLEIDNQRVIEPGAYGVVVNRVRVRLEDGEETGREVERAFVAVEPQPRVVGYGTQIVVRALFTGDETIEYWRSVQMYATSYSPSRAGTPPDAPWYGITASGQPLRKGLVAIDISLIPFGTRMYVPGYGHAEAADVGGGVRGRWIDLGYSDDNFVNWHQTVTVYFLTPVPPAGSIVWVFP